MASIKQPFNPQALRGLLVVVLIVIMSGGAGLFYIGLNQIREYALEVNHAAADATASNDQVQSLQALKGQLAQSQELIAKANQMFATPGNYQSQANTDIHTYANAAGLTVTKTSFEEVPGADPIMTVSLKAPVSYSKLIHFLDGVEGNIPKMQVSAISINHVVNGNADSVAVDDIKLMIATRQ
jgi:Tfp pilus assembly protein PilO